MDFALDFCLSTPLLQTLNDTTFSRGSMTDIWGATSFIANIASVKVFIQFKLDTTKW
jgi:hypothetical protein